jgi:hypothetical protein
LIFFRSLYIGRLFILNNLTEENQIITTKIVLKPYQNSLWAKSKKRELLIKRADKITILSIFNINREEIEKMRDLILCFGFIGVERFKIIKR